MSNHELLTDDYVAGLLAQDAKDCSLKYSAMGMEAYRSNKTPSSGLRPNTRFLRHIIKDTDAHNKALLAKEAAESEARLNNLEYAGELKRKRSNPNARDIRRRQMGDIHAILGGKKRPRDDGDGDKSRQRTADSSTHGHKSRVLPRKKSDLLISSGSRRHHGLLSERDTDQKDTSPDRDKRRRSRRHRSAESSDEDHDSYRRRTSKRERERCRSPRHERDERDERDERRRKHRHRSWDRSQPRRISPKRAAEPAPSRDEEDSDPLEDLIGPPPPPKLRGRGTIGGAAALDRRFSDSYDPKLDIRREDEGDNPWDDAVESFRDRQKMRLNQDQRMRDAGFTDQQIQRAKGSEQKAELNVVWSKAGEGREWDKGKGLTGSDDDHDD